MPVLQQTDTELKSIQALVLYPVTELYMKIARDLDNYSKCLDNIRVTAIYGGAPMSNQVRKLKSGAQLLVDTAGRTIDLTRRNALKIVRIRWLVLDETVEMLHMGFREESDNIFSAKRMIIRFCYFLLLSPMVQVR